jgi:formate-dependent nitrite reductase membrane component NrfD
MAGISVSFLDPLDQVQQLSLCKGETFNDAALVPILWVINGAAAGDVVCALVQRSADVGSQKAQHTGFDGV